MEHPFSFTREKHLNHLVRVVPLLALAYGVQSYLLLSMDVQGTTMMKDLVMLLGFSLASSVFMLVGYDQRQSVQWGDKGFKVRSWWSTSWKEFSIESIQSIDVIGEDFQFQTVTVTLKRRSKLVFYFVDNGHEFKKAMTPASDIKKAA